MALNIAKPFVNVTDSNGLPYVGAKLFVYLPGTTTLASIYSDEALTVPLTNPLTGVNASDAAGNFPRAYIAAGTYKLRAETSAGVLIWQHDNIDTGLPASTGALPISRGGTGATTAAAARAALDVPSNSEIADIADDIASIQGSLQNIVSSPQGRLTMTTLTPVLTTGVTAGTAVYYTPYIGNLIPIYDGIQFAVSSFSELTLTLSSNHVASAIYDVYVFLNSGTVTLGTGPAWNTATAGAGSRGTGAGTTELQRVGGLLTNANSMTARNGATTYTVAANAGTYVGSIFMDGTNGQLTCHTAYGQSRKWGVWNAYNRAKLILKAGDGTASWTYASGTARPSNNATANSLTLFSGLAECPTSLSFTQYAGGTTSGTTVSGTCLIGVNSTTAGSGKSGRFSINTDGASIVIPSVDIVARHSLTPAIGIHTITALEASPAGTVTYNGTETLMMLQAEWVG